MFVDIDPHSAGNKFRNQRFSWFLNLLSQAKRGTGPLKILDVGGTMGFWQPRLKELPDSPIEVTLLNLSETPVTDPRFTSISGDARDLSRFADRSFHIVHSNSVIEHVGRWRDMRAMANEVGRVGQSYFIQTPSFWFPVEPHCRTPFFQWLPHPWRLSLVMRRQLGFWPQAKTVDEGMETIESAVLVDQTMMAALFPDAELRREKFYGLTKSFTAIRQA